MERIAHLISGMKTDLVIITEKGDIAPAALNCVFYPDFYSYWVAIREVDLETVLKDSRIRIMGRPTYPGFVNVDCINGVLFPFEDIVIEKTKRIRFKL